MVLVGPQSEVAESMVCNCASYGQLFDSREDKECAYSMLAEVYITSLQNSCLETTLAFVDPQDETEVLR